MKNEDENERRRITPEKALEMLKTEGLDLTLELRKRMFCDAKKNGENYQDKLTIEELRKCKGFDEISESETNEIIESLFQLAIVVYNLKE
ncbi:hypothetical protein [Flavobacterium yafengii]|uniref:hypothetical protein n=1 Tax=Flavobacterium yafengii TaxID=3041253 RepID=UPI0024A7CEF0|nr:hypothetical protein [Flavobacterium yafengii]MDI5896986.1 hypothetical protein [Flavobacterium yafengii]